GGLARRGAAHVARAGGGGDPLSDRAARGGQHPRRGHPRGGGVTAPSLAAEDPNRVGRYPAYRLCGRATAAVGKKVESRCSIWSTEMNATSSTIPAGAMVRDDSITLRSTVAGLGEIARAKTCVGESGSSRAPSARSSSASEGLSMVRA